MLLQFCDRCKRPLSEGCIARGEAVQRNSEIICTQCAAAEAKTRAASSRRAEPAGPLSQYAQAVWNCEGCGIPVNALDLIEGRASRTTGGMLCSRCQSSASARVQPAPAAAAMPAPAPSARIIAPSARKSTPARHAVETFLRDAKAEERRPVVPILLFAIVLSMFALSLYFAVTSQQKLNEVMAGRGNEDPERDRRAERPHDTLKTDTPAEKTAPDPAPQPKPADNAPAPQPSMTPDVARDLAAIEQQLATPEVLKLQSKDLADVWEGLIAVGSRRLVAAKPYVRALLREPDDNTRALACRVCAVLSDKESLAQLDSMAENDPSNAVKMEARKAKGRLTGVATREFKDMTADELEKYLRDLRKEIDRRQGKHD